MANTTQKPAVETVEITNDAAANEAALKELAVLVDQLTKELESKEAELKAALEKASAAETAKAELATELAKKEAELKEALSLNEDVQKQLQSLKSAQQSTGNVVITHERKKYEVTTAAFQHEGQKINAQDLQSNKALIATLLEKKVGFLKEIQ